MKFKEISKIAFKNDSSSQSSSRKIKALEINFPLYSIYQFALSLSRTFFGSTREVGTWWRSNKIYCTND